MESIREPPGKATRTRDRGIECTERVVKRLSVKLSAWGPLGSPELHWPFLGTVFLVSVHRWGGGPAGLACADVVAVGGHAPPTDPNPAPRLLLAFIF